MTQDTNLAKTSDGQNSDHNLPTPVETVHAKKPLFTKPLIILLALSITAVFILMFLLYSYKNQIFVEKRPVRKDQFITLCDIKRYTSIEEANSEPDKVCDLNFGGKNFKTFPQEVLKFNNIEIINLSGNQLTEVPLDITKLSHLKELHLSKNKITTLPSEIGQLENLTILDLGTNQLTTVPESIGSLKKLFILNLSDNKISSLPLSLKNLSNLKELFLINNPLPQAEKDRIKKLLPNINITF